MIISTYINLNLFGEHLLPNRLSDLCGLEFNKVVEKGVTVLRKGRYKDQVSPYSSVSLIIEAKEGDDYNELIYNMLVNFRDKTSRYIHEFDIESIILWITFRFDNNGQCGFELTPDNLRLMSEIGATLAVNIDV